MIPHNRLRSPDKRGYARGPIIWLPDNAPKDLVAHELWHVRQFHLLAAVLTPCIAGIIFAVLMGSAFLAAAAIVLTAILVHWWTGDRYDREVAAYGESVRNGADSETVAKILAENYGFDVTPRRARRDIEQAAKEGDLI